MQLSSAAALSGLVLLSSSFNYFMFLSVAPACVHVCALSRGGQKRASDSLELQLLVVGSHRVSAGN